MELISEALWQFFWFFLFLFLVDLLRIFYCTSFSEISLLDEVVFLFKRFGCCNWYLEAFCARFINMLLFNFLEIESIWGCSDSFIAWCLVVGLVANSRINHEYCAEKNSSFGEKNSFENKKLILGSKIWFESWISFKSSF